MRKHGDFSDLIISENAMRLFWKKVDVKGPNDCWLWKGSVNKGYGRYTVNVGMPNERTLGVHQIAWFLEYNFWNGKCVCHTCDIGICCNPAHLWLGTMLANNQDKVAKGRQPYGEQWSTKLNEKQVIEILISEESSSKLAIKYNVNSSHIRHIRTGKVWKRLWKDMQWLR